MDFLKLTHNDAGEDVNLEAPIQVVPQARATRHPAAPGAAGPVGRPAVADGSRRYGWSSSAAETPT